MTLTLLLRLMPTTMRMLSFKTTTKRKRNQEENETLLSKHETFHQEWVEQLEKLASSTIGSSMIDCQSMGRSHFICILVLYRDVDTTYGSYSHVKKRWMNDYSMRLPSRQRNHGHCEFHRYGKHLVSPCLATKVHAHVLFIILY